jgi:omega-3 fatty acid desaturase (delta-15 desaturase)
MPDSLTLASLKEAIPSHCFNKSLLRSSYYMARNLLLLSTAFFTYPLFAYYAYLFFGYNDGCHVIPWSRLYRRAKRVEKIKCIISTFCIALVLFGLIAYSGGFYQFCCFYGLPWIVFSFWLFMVTYMQHHKEETLLFDDSSWTFLDGALETVDRRFGFGIDEFHHNITDGHLVHHLFFSQIPHYHLKEATDAIQKLLQRKKIYHYIKRKFFVYDFFKLFLTQFFINWKLKNRG